MFAHKKKRTRRGRSRTGLHKGYGAKSHRKRRSRKSANRPGAVGRALRFITYWTFIAGVWLVVVALGLVVWYGAKLPQSDQWSVPDRPANVRIVAVNGELVANRGSTGGERTKLKDLPPYMPRAVLAIEDRRFYGHWGVDPVGLVRAIINNLVAGSVVQGGSTITQQLAKNLFLKPERTLERKVQELILAFWLEANYSKDQILQMYLNRVYMGAGAYGVDAAARVYFGKSARHVSLLQASVLAGLLQAPSRLSPLNNSKNSRKRASQVLKAMVGEGYITKATMAKTLKQPLYLATIRRSSSFNYVADWVMAELPGYLGKFDRDIVVNTTIDYPLQLESERTIRNIIKRRGKKLKVSQGAAITIDASGRIKALIGGKNYDKSQYNRATVARRQPGSAFKAFVYLAAMEQGYTPETMAIDRPITIGKWRPANYKKYYGRVTLREAFARSLNTVAVHLAQRVGLDKVRDTAKKMGIRSKLHSLPSIALGTSEVTLLELTSSFVPFANGGVAVIPHLITKITTSTGKVLYQRKGSGLGVVLTRKNMLEMNDLLRSVVNKPFGTGKKAVIPGVAVSGKTGTSQQYRDSWFIGYADQLITGVWFGNDNNSPMNKVTGGSLPTIAWHQIMIMAHRKLVKNHPLPILHPPSGIGDLLDRQGRGSSQDRVLFSNDKIPIPPISVGKTDNKPPPVPMKNGFDQIKDLLRTIVSN